MITSDVAGYSVSTMANRGDYSDDNNGVIVALVTLLAIAVIGLVVSIVINVVIGVKLERLKFVCN